MKIILYQPQIPQNTGNIVRTCKITGSDLILVKPLGFSTSDRALKRAGLDYWDGVNVSIIENLESYLKETENPFFFFSSKATRFYTEESYSQNVILIFGSETKGLPEHFFSLWPNRLVKIPMKSHRCLNLSSAVAVGIYEAWRQQQFIS